MPFPMRKPVHEAGASAPAAPAAPARERWWKRAYSRHPGPVSAVAGALVTLVAVFAGWTIGRQQMPPMEFPAPGATGESPAAQAYAAVRPSVVKVRALGEAPKKGGEPPEQVGTGVVMTDKGIILTN